MNYLKSILTLLLIFTLMSLKAQSTTLNLKTSSLTWTGKAAFNSYSLTGTLETKEGFLTVSGDSITDLKVVMNMKRIDHENSDLKSHLKGSDFFDVKNYETAIFQISYPVVIKENKVALIGNMTIKDVTRKETITVIINKESLSMNFDFSLDRTAYGIIFNSPNFFKKMKENAIADTFKLKGTLSFE